MHKRLTSFLGQTLIGTALLIGLASLAGGQVYVDRKGSSAPDGSAGRPYQELAAGVCAVNDRLEKSVAIRGGTYPETITIRQPLTLTASVGSAEIGRVNGRTHTTLKLVTYNTHLFGGKLGGSATFADETRAGLIADKVRAENADVVALQEVWDDDLADKIVQRAGYPFSFYGKERDEATDFLHSGLLLLSKYPLNASLTHYTDEVSITQCPAFDPTCPIRNPTQPWKCLADCKRYDDAFASKGFIQATIVKEGFSFGIFTTHTQAEFHDDALAARRKQCNQLGAQIRDYRRKNPGAEVIAMGDFNVIGANNVAGEPDRREYLESLLGGVGLNDAYRNVPLCTAASRDANQRNTCDANRNKLAEFFQNNEADCQGQRLDYMLYSHGNAFDVLPMTVVVRQYQVSPAIIEAGAAAKDLSDHYGLMAEFSIYR